MTVAEQQLSGNAYVPAVLRAEGGKRQKIKVSIPKFCDHTSTVCPTPSCVESWSIDWDLLFKRTAGGRRLFAGAYPDKELPA